jgi:signal transduction histidine kinase
MCRQTGSRSEQSRHTCGAQEIETAARRARGVAHDLKNMVHAVSGYAERVLRRLAPNDPLRDDVRQIVAAAERSSELTREFLAACQGQVTGPEVLDLNAVVRRVCDKLVWALGDEVAVETVSQPDLGRVKADPAELERVIINLVLNARDAMPQGGTLRIETKNVLLPEHSDGSFLASPGPHVMLTVSDTGCGMDEATCARAFEPYFTTKRDRQGTGLGLASVRSAVREMAGDIRVYSKPGNGTTFEIALPRVDSMEEFRGPVSANTLARSREQGELQQQL